MRNKTIDIVKGMGIILVVISHSISNNVFNDTVINTNGLFNIITSFFMPMFLMVSGYLIYGKVSRTGWLKEHIIKWIYPLLSFTIIYWVFGSLFPGVVQWILFRDVSFPAYIISLLTFGFNGLVSWYLWTTILCYILAYALEQGRLKLKVPLILQFIGLMVAVNLLPVAYFGFLTLKWYAIFFLIGYMLNHYKIKRQLAYISLAVFPLCIYLFNWMIPYQDLQYGCFGLGSIIPAIMHGKATLVGIMFLMAILGTTFIYALSLLVRWKPLVWILSYLGSASIGIYLLHILFIGLVHNYWLAVLVSICVSVVLYELLRRIKFLDIILFGRSLGRVNGKI